MNGWKTLTDMEVNKGEPEPFFHLPFTLLPIGTCLSFLGCGVRKADRPAESIQQIEEWCSELLIHAADVEGLCQGIDGELVEREPPLSTFIS